MIPTMNLRLAIDRYPLGLMDRRLQKKDSFLFRPLRGSAHLGDAILRVGVMVLLFWFTALMVFQWVRA